MRVLPTKWRRKPAGIDIERNYVTVTLCISRHVPTWFLYTVFLYNHHHNSLGHWVTGSTWCRSVQFVKKVNPHPTLITDHFSGPYRALGRVCVCVCVLCPDNKFRIKTMVLTYVLAILVLSSSWLYSRGVVLKKKWGTPETRLRVLDKDLQLHKILILLY